MVGNGVGDLISGSTVEVSRAGCDEADRARDRRLVFRALNSVEVVFAVILVVVILAKPPPTGVIAAVLTALATLAAQLLVVRPFLNRRSAKVLAGLDAPRSRGHYAYVGLEAVKVTALVVAGVLLLVTL